MKAHREFSAESMAPWIDRLVSGELDDASRRRLLHWLDADPRRWRQCGLAFLEAQSWEQAFGPANCEREFNVSPSLASSAERLAFLGPTLSKSDAPTSGAHPAPAAHRHRARPGMAWIAVAASVLASFAAGYATKFSTSRPAGVPNQESLAKVSKDQPHERSQSGAGAKRPPKKPVPSGAPSKPAARFAREFLIPVSADGATKPGAGGTLDVVPEHVVQQWRRRGYRLTQGKKFLPAYLTDGRRVVVPVASIELEYVGPEYQ